MVSASFFFMALSGCNGSPPGTEIDGTEDSGVPSSPLLAAASITVPESPNVRLVKILELTTTEPVTVMVHLSDSAGVTRDLPFGSLDTQHALPLLGLRLEESYVVGVTLTSEGGEGVRVDEVATFTTDPPDNVWPKLEVATALPGEMEPGYTLFGVNAFSSQVGEYLFVMDPEGHVVWYYVADGDVLDARINAAGNLLCLFGADFVELDFLGNELGRWNANGANGGTVVGVTSFHHEANELPNGNLLGLVDRTELHESYPASYNDPTITESAAVLSHDVVEFDRSGNIVRDLPLWDVLDQDRIGYDGLTDDPRDWVHSNAVTFDPSDPDRLLVSLRHQDAIISLDRTTGALRWILGTHANWAPEFDQYLLDPLPGTEWSYHTHGPSYTSEGRIVVFDNGNYRVSPFDGQPVPDEADQYSRLVEYAVDETDMSVEQTWEFRGPNGDALFSFATGSAVFLPQKRTVLGMFGFLNYVNGVANTDVGRGVSAARLIEVNKDTDKVVLDVTFYSDAGDHRPGWHGFRAVRIPSLYMGTTAAGL